MAVFRLTRKERRALERFVSTTNDKVEYIRGTALLMRAKRRKVKGVAQELHICMGAVFKWTSIYRRSGVDGLKRRHPSGRPPVVKDKAKKIIPELMKKDPKLFGFLKGRWVVRDMVSALKSEGIRMSKSHMHRMLRELGLSYKRPKLTVKSPDPHYRVKERMVKNYKKAAPALEKRGLL